MRVLVAKNSGVSWYYRCRLPYEALSKNNPEIEVHIFQPTIADLENDWDVCVFAELDTPYGEIFLNECKKRKIATVIDIDDDVFSLLPTTDVYGEFYKRGFGEPTDKLRFLIRNLMGADLTTVTTRVLQDVYSPINSNILVVPNQIDLSTWSADERFEKDSKIWIGWQGTYNHWDDFMVVREPLTQILRESIEVQLVIAGFPEVIHQFPQDIHSKIYLVPFSDNLHRVAKLCRSCDIGIAPLYDCSFNRAKSDLKVLQYGAVGLCTVASHVCYSNTISDQKNGLLATSSSDWYASLSKLIKDENVRKELGQALKQYVHTERSLENNLEKWKLVLNTAKASFS
jgi:glycosyltransferase involved in cell wall biosynthesis